MGTSDAFLPILLMFTAAAILGAALLFLNGVMGRKVRTLRKLGPFLDDSRKRISVKFFIVAMVFILFDVETGFLWPWATVLDEGGWVVFWPMILFLAVLALADAYLWKKGAFDWE